MPEETIPELKKQIATKDRLIEELQKKLGHYQKSGAVGFYYELQRLMNTTVEYMRTSNIKELIDGDKGDKSFERLMALVKEGKANVDALEELRLALKLTGKEDVDVAKHRNTFTPEAIADVRSY